MLFLMIILRFLTINKLRLRIMTNLTLNNFISNLNCTVVVAVVVVRTDTVNELYVTSVLYLL